MSAHSRAMPDLLNPVWAALTGPHERFSQRLRSAAAYESDVSPFAALLDPSDPQAWNDLSELSRGRAVAVFSTPPEEIANGWETTANIDVLQMIHRPPVARVESELVPPLGPDDVGDMLDLVSATEPGPFLPGTITLGRYFGLRSPSGELSAMGGQRFDTGTYQEVSAICTRPTHRGQGQATRILRSVLADIAGSGREAFLHVATANPAVGLYRREGFQVHQRHTIHVLRAVS